MAGQHTGAEIVVMFLVYIPLMMLVGFLTALPIFIATKRKMTAVLKLVVLNSLFAWTVVGWIACLIWAIVGQVEDSI